MTLPPHLSRPLFGLILALALISAAGCATGTGRAPPAPAAGADAAGVHQVILELLDTQALYTVSGGLKPISSGFWQARIDLGEPDLAEVEAMSAALARAFADAGLATGFAVGIQPFAQVWEEEGQRQRHLEAVVVHRRALAKLIEREREFFAPLGITRHSEPMEVLAIVERLPRLDRYRGYGHLFGYPSYAIDFFVATAAEQERTGEFVERGFFHVPTYAADEGRFVWAVPHDHVEREEDRTIRLRAAGILVEYRRQRQRLDLTDDRSAHRLLRRMAG